MLDRMFEFDFRNAKCTLETDRLAIEEQAPSAYPERDGGQCGFDPQKKGWLSKYRGEYLSSETPRL
jgi:hypothetical protein